MARTGTPSVIKYARKICRIVSRFGASDLGDRTTPAFQLAVTALVAACLAFEALDDYPGEIDATGPNFTGDPDLNP